MAVNIEEYIPGPTEKPRVHITSDKFKAKFTVQPAPGGYVMYEIVTNVASLPNELKGRYTRIKEAVDAVKRYEHKHPGTKSVQLDTKRKQWAKEKDGSAVRGSSSSDVHQGSDNGEVGANLS